MKEGLRQLWQRVFPLKGEVVEPPKDWSKIRYYNAIAPRPDPISPQGSFYMDRFLTQNGHITGVCRESQAVHNSIHVWKLEFNAGHLLEEDYANLLWSLIEFYVSDNRERPDYERSYKKLVFENADDLNKELLEVLGAEATKASGHQGGWRITLDLHADLQSRKDAFFNAFKAAREKAEHEGRKLFSAARDMRQIEKKG